MKPFICFLLCFGLLFGGCYYGCTKPFSEAGGVEGWRKTCNNVGPVGCCEIGPEACAKGNAEEIRQQRYNAK